MGNFDLSRLLKLSAPLIPNPPPSKGEGGSSGSASVLIAMQPASSLLPLREKVAAKRSDEGGAERPRTTTLELIP